MIEPAKKKITLILLTTFALMLYGHAAPGSVVSYRDELGYLIVECRYGDLDVIIDGKPRGRISDAPFGLLPGEHKIVIPRPSRSNWLDEDWAAEVSISTADTVRLSVVFQKSYAVNSTPYGANVFLEGELIGKTPVYFTLGDDEIGAVRVEKVGFEPIAFKIGETDRQFYNLKLQDDLEGISASDKMKPDEPSDKSSHSSYLYAALGITVLSGGLALYFRDAANNKYEQYRQTGNPEAIDRFFNETKKYDRYAAASFVVFQASFVASFYLTLKSLNK